TTPCKQRLWASTFTGFRLIPVRSPLLRESLLISFPRGTEMFHFPRLPSMTYGFSHRYPALSDRMGSPIRISPGLRLLAAHRGISVLAPSFIGIQRLGIRRAPFLA